MTLENMKDFLNDMIEAFPGYKSRIVNPTGFVESWFDEFRGRDLREMKEAAVIITTRKSFFPTIPEFKKALYLIDSRKALARQAEYERRNPTPPEDQAKIQFIIDDIFGG